MLPAFEQVTRRNHAAIKTSALFQFVTKRPAVLKFDSVKSKIIADGNAYLLLFKEPIDSDAFVLFADAGYEFDTANPPHVRFDKEYGNPTSSIYRNKFFAHWHYTERLVRKSDGATAIIHYYFHRSILLDLVVTRADGSKYVLDPSTRVKLEKNAERALMVMSLLFKQLDKYKQELNDKFEALIAQTSTNEFVNKATVGVLRTNLQKLEDLSAAINELEEEFTDCRIRLIQTRFELCIANKIKPESITKTTQDSTVDPAAPVEVPEPSITTTQSVTGKAPAAAKATDQRAIVAKLLATLLSDANAIKTAYQTAVAKDLVGLDARRQDMINELLVAFISSKDTAAQKRIESMQKEILALQTLPDYLEKYLLAGDYKSFVTLYEAAKLKITQKTFAKYIGTFISEEFAQRESEHVKICEYLHENASEYSSFLEFMRSLTNLLEGKFGDEKAVICSLFHVLVNHDLFEFFKMLILQIRNPNVFGLQVGKHIMSLISSIMQLDSGDRYVDFLIEQGAQTEGMSYSNKYLMIEQITSDHKLAALAILPMARRGSLVHSPAGTTSKYDLYIALAQANSCLANSLLCCFMPDSVTHKFAALASLYDVAYACAYYLSTADRIGRVNAKVADMRNYTNNDTKNNELGEIFAQTARPCNHFVFGFYFARPDQQHKGQLSIDLLKSRIAAEGEPALKTTIKNLADHMTRYKKLDDWRLASIFGDAALYCTNYLTPNAQRHKFITWLIEQLVQINQSRFAASRDTRYQSISNVLRDQNKLFISVSEFGDELAEPKVDTAPRPR